MPDVAMLITAAGMPVGAGIRPAGRQDLWWYLLRVTGGVARDLFGLVEGGVRSGGVLTAGWRWCVLGVA